MALGATLTRTLQAVITADASRFSREMDGAARSADTFGAKLRRGVGKAAPFAAAGLAAFGAAAAMGIRGIMDDEAALANFENSLNATGNAVRVNSKAFWRYAEAQQASTGIGADQIAQGAALLATFKNVRNEVGKGNDVFMRATTAAADLSAKGFGSLESANKMLGKALNDPVKGITALSRAGVTFTAQQKEQIKALTESGDLLGAQKIILGEVESQVGGAAKAYGETTAGQVKRAQLAFGELTETLAASLLPIIQTLLGIFQRFAGWIQENQGLAKVAAIAFVGLASAILAVNAALKVVGAISALSNPIVAVGLAVAAIAAGVVILYQRSEKFRDIVSGAWEAVKKAVEIVVDVFDGPVKAAFRTVQGVAEVLAGLLTGDFSRAWDGMKKAVGGVLDWLKETMLALPATILTAAVGIGSAIVRGVASGVATIGQSVWDTIKGLPANLLGRVGAWLTGLANIGGKVIDYIAAGVSGLAADVWAKITNMPAALLGLAAGWLTGLASIGGKVIDWIAAGATGLAAAVWGKISGFGSALLTLVTSGAKDTITGIGSKIIDWIENGIKNAAKGLADTVKGAVNLGIDALNIGIKGTNKGIRLLNKAIPFGDPIDEIPLIPRLARGGIVTQATTALVGERGAEAVVPLTGNRGRQYLARVLADVERDRPVATGGGTTVVLNVHGVMSSDVREFAQRLKPELDRVLVAGF